MIKKISAVLLAGLILFNLFGYYFVFRSEQAVLKEEMRGLIRSHKNSFFLHQNITAQRKDFFRSNCEQIIVSLNDPGFQWVEKGEFRFRGKLYDVISQISSGQQITFYCINDRQEETLLSAYHRITDLLTGITFPGKSKMRTALLHHLIKVALVKERSLLTSFKTFIKIFPSEAVCCYQQYIHPINPPPKEG